MHNLLVCPLHLGRDLGQHSVTFLDSTVQERTGTPGQGHVGNILKRPPPIFAA